MKLIIVFSIVILGTIDVRAFELSLSVDGTILNLETGSKISLQKDQKTEVVERHPMWVESPGRVPVLLVPLNSENGMVKVNSPMAEKILQEASDINVDKELSGILLKIGEIQFLISQKNYSQSLQKISELKTQHPNVKYLDFIDASVAFLSGDKKRAIASVNSGLAAHPNYEPGLALQKNLTGQDTKTKSTKGVGE